MKDILITRKNRFDSLISAGFTADIENGIIYNNKGNISGSLYKTTGYIYLKTIVDGIKVRVLAHQFVYYLKHGDVVEYIDHIDGNRANNSVNNLRAVTHQQNMFNRKTTKGYYWEKSKSKWRSCIRLNGIKKHLGSFNTEQEARQAYLEAKGLYHKIEV